MNMKRKSFVWSQFLFLALTAVIFFFSGCNSNDNGDNKNDGGSTQTLAQSLPNMGQQITPLAPLGSRFESLNPDLADNPNWLAGHAVTTVVSPDKKTLLVLTSGYNRVYRTDSVLDVFGTYFNWAESTEYVFIYDISLGTPIKKQVVKVPNTYHGIVFDPSGTAFYVSNGMGDFPFDSSGNIVTTFQAAANVPGDSVHIFMLNALTGIWGEQSGTALALSHPTGNGLDVEPSDGTLLPPNERVAVSPCAAGLAISQDGKTLVVANYFNDSISIFKGGLGNWTRQQPNSSQPDFDLRPGKSGGVSGTPGGEYPFWVVVKGNGSSATAYVSSVRDREIVVVSLGDVPAVTGRIKVKGQPNKMTLNKTQSLLYVAEDQTDTVDIIDTVQDKIVETIPVIAPASVLPSSLANYTGANTNSVTLSPDERQLYVTNGNLNCVAVVALSGTNSGDSVIGLIPTGWYPNSVSFSGDGNTVYVVNAKSPTGPNPGFYYSYGPPTHKNGYGTNLYNPQLTKAGLQSFPRPNTEQLASLSSQVAVNNRFAYTVSARDAAIMADVRSGIKHVIFIIKENRTYDQILGDLEIGNGDPGLATFGEPLTPNQHNLARRFVTLDNFYDTAEVSYDGWAWTTAARATDVVQHQYPVMYAGRGLSLECDGANRSVNVAITGVAARQAANPLTPDDPDLLPGNTNNDAADGPNNEVNTGYLWDAALRANLTVRSYGFWVDGTRYSFPQPPAPTSEFSIPLVRMPALTNPPTQVAFSESVSLTPFTDIYFRGFDNAFPDYWRFREWEREFDAFEANGGLPSLSLVRFMHDHTGNFATAIDRVNTPELMQADNDYAVGLLVQKIANSQRYANNTLIFVIEDDAQDGPDHVDSHRSIAFVAGAYVKQRTLVSTQYNTIDFIRTIEEVLGLLPMNLNDALARPMADIFNTTPSAWSFSASPSPYLYGTDLAPLLPVVTSAGMVVPKSTHSAKYWAAVTKGMDFSSEDKFNFAVYNRILWKGLMGNKPYPAVPTGKDLRKNRKEYLAKYLLSLR
jgi:DNA-binding beta-propeller fold protein YncE